MSGVSGWLQEDPIRYQRLVLSMSIFGFVMMVGPLILPFVPGSVGQNETIGAILFAFLAVISLIHGREPNREDRA